MNTEIHNNFPNNWQQRYVIVPAIRWMARYYFRARCHQLEQVPKDRPVIYVAKHPRSMLYLETVVLGVHTFIDSGRPPFRVMEKRNTSMHKIPGIGWLRRHVGALPASAEAAQQALQSGQSLLIFPGGARELYGRPDTLRWQEHRGFARLAIAAQAPVVPVAMVGADQQHLARLPLGRSSSLWLPLFPMPVRLDYWFGTPLIPPPVADDDKIVRRFANEVRNATDSLLRRGLATRRQQGTEHTSSSEEH